MTSADEIRLQQVLEGLSYPAQKWQVVTWAEFYGADATTRTELGGLPLATYHDVEEVIAAVAGCRLRPAQATSQHSPSQQPASREPGTWRAAS